MNDIVGVQIAQPRQDLVLNELNVGMGQQSGGSGCFHEGKQVAIRRQHLYVDAIGVRCDGECGDQIGVLKPA